MKFTDHRLQLTVLILLLLPLFGWGCADKSAVSNQPEAGQDTVASADTTSSLDTTSLADTSALDTTKPKDIVIEDADGIKGNQKDASPDVNVPAGWKVYKNNVQKISFSYPGDWFTAEKQGNDGFYVYVNQTPWQKLPPEPIAQVTVIISDESLESVANVLKEQDGALQQDVAVVGGKSYPRLRYKSELLGDYEYVYFGFGFQLWHIDNDQVNPIAKQILTTVGGA